jgi:hypothetical protein
LRDQLLADLAVEIAGDVISEEDVQLTVMETDYDGLPLNKGETARIIVFLLERSEMPEPTRREAYSHLRTSIHSRRPSNPVNRISGIIGKAYKSIIST